MLAATFLVRAMPGERFIPLTLELAPPIAVGWQEESARNPLPLLPGSTEPDNGKARLLGLAQYRRLVRGPHGFSQAIAPDDQRVLAVSGMAYGHRDSRSMALATWCRRAATGAGSVV